MAAFAPIFGLLFLLLLLSAARSLWVTLMPPRGRPRVPSCEKCSYPVAGLASLNCPECGSDFRAVGITTQAMEMRRRGSLSSAIASWTLLWLVAAGFIVGRLGAVIGPVAASIRPMTTTITSLTPNSQSFSSLRFEVETDSRGVTRSIRVKLTDRTGKMSELQVGRDLGDAKLIDNQGAELGSVPIDGILCSRFWRVAQIGSPSSVEQQEFDSLLQAATWRGGFATAAAGMTAFRLTSSSTTTASAGAAAALWESLLFFGACAVAMAIWIAAVIWIVRRRRRLLRHSQIAEPASVVAPLPA